MKFYGVRTAFWRRCFTVLRPALATQCSCVECTKTLGEIS